MIKSACDIIVDHHSELLERFGPDDPRVVWNSRESQESRFAVLMEVGDFRGATVLDVGCGLGDLCGYLRRRNHAPRQYHGCDINPNMIEAAREKFSEAIFEVRDLIENPYPTGSFDYVVESGIFNIVIPDWEDVTYATLRRMFQACRRAVAVNFLSRLSGNANPAARYSLPSEILAFVESELSTRFVLRHDYRANDFTIFIYK